MRPDQRSLHPKDLTHSSEPRGDRLAHLNALPVCGLILPEGSEQIAQLLKLAVISREGQCQRSARHERRVSLSPRGGRPGDHTGRPLAWRTWACSRTFRSQPTGFAVGAVRRPSGPVFGPQVTTDRPSSGLDYLSLSSQLGDFYRRWGWYLPVHPALHRYVLQHREFHRPFDPRSVVDLAGPGSEHWGWIVQGTLDSPTLKSRSTVIEHAIFCMEHERWHAAVSRRLRL